MHPPRALQNREKGRRVPALSTAFVAGELLVQPRWLGTVLVWTAAAVLLVADVLLLERCTSFR